MRRCSSDFVRITEGGIEFAVRLTPKSSRDAVEGTETDAAGRHYLKARVRAVPEDGAANTSLCALVAQTLGVSKSAVRIASGATSRLKTLHVSGDTSLLAEKLERLATGKPA